MNSYISEQVVPLSFSISVDSPAATYIVGQPVAGHVFFSLPAPIRAKSVTIELVAETRVRVLLVGGRAVRQAVPERRHRIAVCRPQAALWVPPYMSDRRLAAGNSTLAFAVDTKAFPRGMPGSLDAPYGSVRYFLRARIERHSFDNTGDHFAELEVTMLPALNVEWSILAKPSEATSPKEESSPVHVTAVVGHTGFLAGDEATVEVRVANSSRGKCVESVEVALVQKTSYASGELSRADLKVLDTRQALEVPVGPGGSAVASATLRVPADAHVTVANKRVALTYYVRVEAVGARGAVLARASAPVVVGTVRIPHSARSSNAAAEVAAAEACPAQSSAAGAALEATNAEVAQKLQEEQQMEDVELALGQSHARSKSSAGCSGDSCSASSASSCEGLTNLKASRECKMPTDLLA
eukprot:m51a1_g9309 hypothetical protein (412) ;mRNA; r:95475-96854